jgi:hypothetical protein
MMKCLKLSFNKVSSNIVESYLKKQVTPSVFWQKKKEMKKKTQKEHHKALIINELFFCVSSFSQKEK